MYVGISSWKTRSLMRWSITSSNFSNFDSLLLTYPSLRRLKWAGHVARIEEGRSVFKILTGYRKDTFRET